jgi:thiamine-phosphate pyrophosphorylase
VSHQLLRILDANLNRSREGLRVLEDVARFLLDDGELSRGLKTIRHDLARETRSLRIGLLSDRDSEHDVGHPSATPYQTRELDPGKTSHKDLPDLVRANARRVEESLRVVEELAKLPELSSVLNSADLEQIRFALYGFERELFSRIFRRDKRIRGLYVILDPQFLAGRDELEVAGQIIEGGAGVIQLRDKRAEKGELLAVAGRLRELCGRAGALFIINDYLDVAVAVDADGLHVGPRDLPLPVVRKHLPVDKIVGCSSKTVAQAVKAQTEGADYVAVGSIFPTATKKEITVVGADILRELKAMLSIPLVAVGGISQSNVGEVLAAGADAAAVVSAVLGQKDVKRAARELVTKMEEKGRCQSE